MRTRLLKADLRAAAHLPETRQPRTNRQPAPLPGPVAGYLAGQRRPRTNQRHLAHEHVDQLRRLVETGAPQQAADPCNPRVAAV